MTTELNEEYKTRLIIAEGKIKTARYNLTFGNKFEANWHYAEGLGLYGNLVDEIEADKSLPEEDRNRLVDIILESFESMTN